MSKIEIDYTDGTRAVLDYVVLLDRGVQVFHSEDPLLSSTGGGNSHGIRSGASLVGAEPLLMFHSLLSFMSAQAEAYHDPESENYELFGTTEMREWCYEYSDAIGSMSVEIDNWIVEN